LLEFGADVVRLMTETSSPPAIILVCGDAHGMAKGVFSALLLAIQQTLKVDEKRALEIRTGWMKQKRLIMEVWA